MPAVPPQKSQRPSPPYGRPHSAVLSEEIFRQLRRHGRYVLPVEQLSQADLAAIDSAEVPAEYRHLDRELDPLP